MENWHEGEVPGAFILRAPLESVDDVSRAGNAQEDATSRAIFTASQRRARRFFAHG